MPQYLYHLSHFKIKIYTISIQIPLAPPSNYNRISPPPPRAANESSYSELFGSRFEKASSKLYRLLNEPNSSLYVSSLIFASLFTNVFVSRLANLFTNVFASLFTNVFEFEYSRFVHELKSSLN